MNNLPNDPKNTTFTNNDQVNPVSQNQDDQTYSSPQPTPGTKTAASGQMPSGEMGFPFGNVEKNTPIYNIESSPEKTQEKLITPEISLKDLAANPEIVNDITTLTKPTIASQQQTKVVDKTEKISSLHHLTAYDGLTKRADEEEEEFIKEVEKVHHHDE